MKLNHRLRGSVAKWYVLGIATAVAAGWIGGGSHPATPPAASNPEAAATFAPSSEAIELVHTARARERDGDSAGARSAYLEAAAILSPIGDYLRLRAAQLTSDSSGRQALYAAVQTSPARDQVRTIEARIRERAGDLEGAARQRQDLGQAAEVFRLRLLQGGDQGPRRAVLRDLIRWVTDSSTSPQRNAVALAALPYNRELNAVDLLLLARASGSGSGSAAATAFFDRATARGARLTTADFAAWGEAFYVAGSYRSAVTKLRRVSSGLLLPRSLLLRGRAMLRSGQRGGRAVLDDLVRRFPSDTSSTPTALFLLGDLARDANDYTTARRRWSQVAERFPSSEEAPRAQFLVGLIRYSQGDRIGAAKVWDSLFLAGQGREEALSGGYWSGRAYFELGDTASASARWRQVIIRSRLSYYSRLSYRRLGLRDSTLADGPDQFADVPSIEKARQRLELLTATGLGTELGLEATWLASQAGTELTTVVGTASLLRDHNRATFSAQLGWRALEAGAAESRTYRLIFPLLFADPLVASSRAQNLDPALTAALIRQESLFDSMATSRAGARGLMQLMPAVGRELARARRWSSWHSDSLYQPTLNLALGTAHLSWALQRYGGLERTLAAYNAGGSRVTRWARFPGSRDPEVFVEWIPFPETRTYVRTVLRNLDFYRALYTW
jgi:soluble lytic murein transglycosylase-like protein/TolA-binding protein